MDLHLASMPTTSPSDVIADAAAGRPVGSSTPIRRLPRQADWVVRALSGVCTELWLLVQPRPAVAVNAILPVGGSNTWRDTMDRVSEPAAVQLRRCPVGGPGDIVWVAEPHWRVQGRPLAPSPLEPAEGAEGPDGDVRLYADAGMVQTVPAALRTWVLWTQMPPWASRLHLSIEAVHPRRLHSVASAEAVAAGFSVRYGCPRTAFAVDYERRHGQGSWRHDAWMWRIQFQPMAIRGIPQRR